MPEPAVNPPQDLAQLLPLKRWLQAMPYARHLGLELQQGEQGLVCVLHAREEHWGNPRLCALHGGVVGGVMEIAGQMELLRLGAQAMARVVDSTVEYLRPATGSVFYAGARSLRLGRRVAFLQMHLWSEDVARPVAMAQANYALAAPLRRYIATQ